MKTSVIIGVCLALLQTGNAQNETILETTKNSTSNDSSTITVEPSTTQFTTDNPYPTLTSVLENKTKIVEKLSEQIRSILKHFHEPIPTGFPGQVILADPMTVPNTTVTVTLGTADFYNLTVHGLSNFTLETVDMFLDGMEVYVAIHMKKIIITGNIKMIAAFFETTGPISLTLTNVTAYGTVSLKVDPTGKLYAEKSVTDMTYDAFEVRTNATGSIVQTGMNIAGMALFMSVKPQILDQINKRINEEVNKQLESSPKFPAIVNRSPVDLAVIEGRKYVRKLYEPFTISNVVNHDSEYLSVNVGPVTIKGLSNFARVGTITVQMKEGVVQLIARFITGKLNGDCQFYYDFGKVGNSKRNSTAKFAIDHLQFEAKVNQSVDLRTKPVLHDLQIEVGKIHLKLDGNGDFDFLVEMVVGLIPDMIKGIIIDSMENSIKEILQSKILDKINVEQLIEDNLPFMENFIVV